VELLPPLYSRICELDMQRSVIWYVWWRSWACRDFVTSKINALSSNLLLLTTTICFCYKCRDFDSSGWSSSPSLLCSWFSGLAFVGLVRLHVRACWSVWLTPIFPDSLKECPSLPHFFGFVLVFSSAVCRWRQIIVFT